MDTLISWLMDSPIASIRYLTLRRLVGKSEADADVQAAREAMRTSGPIPTIPVSSAAWITCSRPPKTAT